MLLSATPHMTKMHAYTPLLGHIPLTPKHDLETQAVTLAAASFQARPRGELAGWKKRWHIHATIVRASAAEVLRLQTINTEPDQTDCHFCIKAHKDALALLLSREQSKSKTRAL